MTVALMRASLTQEDIYRLVRGESENERAQAAVKICRRIDQSPMSEADRAYAAEILDLMARDAAGMVRRALATTLQNSPRLPREIALKLARDIDEVAIPVLARSPALSEDDLLALLEAAPPIRQAAVASRPDVPERVCAVLAEKGEPPAVQILCENEGARLSEPVLDRLLDRFSEDDSIKGALIDRSVLPVRIAERLVSLTTGEIFDRLVNRHELSAQLAIEIANGARERATLDLVEQAGLSSDPERFVQQLNLNGRLNPSLIMRGLCLGHMQFVEYALAELAGVPRSKAWLMIHDAGALGLKTIIERAGLPAGLYPAFRLALEVYHQTETEGGLLGRERFRRRLLERILTRFQAIPRADLDYLLEKLDALDARAPGRRQPAA